MGQGGEWPRSPSATVPAVLRRHLPQRQGAESLREEHLQQDPPHRQCVFRGRGHPCPLGRGLPPPRGWRGRAGGSPRGVTPGCPRRRDRAAGGTHRRLQEQHRPLLLRHRQLPRERGGWGHLRVAGGHTHTPRGARGGGDTPGWRVGDTQEWWVGDTEGGRLGEQDVQAGYLGVPGLGTQRGHTERSPGREGTQKVPPGCGGWGGGGSTLGWQCHRLTPLSPS